VIVSTHGTQRLQTKQDAGVAAPEQCALATPCAADHCKAAASRGVEGEAPQHRRVGGAWVVAEYNLQCTATQAALLRMVEYTNAEAAMLGSGCAPCESNLCTGNQLQQPTP
jgi:hypothetical protein